MAASSEGHNDYSSEVDERYQFDAADAMDDEDGDEDEDLSVTSSSARYDPPATAYPVVVAMMAGVSLTAMGRPRHQGVGKEGRRRRKTTATATVARRAVYC